MIDVLIHNILLCDC